MRAASVDSTSLRLQRYFRFRHGLPTSTPKPVCPLSPWPYLPPNTICTLLSCHRLPLFHVVATSLCAKIELYCHPEKRASCPLLVWDWHGAPIRAFFWRGLFGALFLLSLTPHALWVDIHLLSGRHVFWAQRMLSGVHYAVPSDGCEKGVCCLARLEHIIEMSGGLATA